MKNSFILKKRKEFFLSLLLLFFFFSLFLSFFVALRVILMGLIVLYIFFYNPISEKFNIGRQRKHIWLMSGFSLLLLLSLAFSDNVQMGQRFLVLRLPLIIFPLSLGLIYIPRHRRNQLLLGMAVITTVCCLASLVYAAGKSIREEDSAWLYNDALSSLIGQQSIYTSALVNISIYIFSYFLFFDKKYVKYSGWIILSIAVLFIISYLLASRMMMGFLYLSALAFLFYYSIKMKKYKAVLALVTGLAITGALFYTFFPSTINRFRELGYTNFEYTTKSAESHYAGELTADQWNGANFRLAAWQCGWQLFKEHPLAGVGLGDKEDELNKVYLQKGFQFAIDTHKNVHNNYLDIAFSLGVAGLLLFLAGWLISPLITLFRFRDGLGIIILLTFSAAMITEVYFDRSLGGLFVGFFVSLILTPYPAAKEAG